MIQIEYELIPNWPPAAWIASLSRDTDTVRVRHGSRVDIHSNWFGEIIWDGDYQAAAFDKTDIVFGSGGKIREETSRHPSMTFVGSASTLDRMHWAQIESKWLVSNSLVCLLAETNAELDPGYVRFHHDFLKILQGIDGSDFCIRTNKGEVRLTYYRNLFWDGKQLTEIEKPAIQRSRDSFAGYKAFLEAKLAACGENLRSANRQNSFDFIGTASSGFDSPTVAALGQAGGLREVVSISNSRSGEDDSGQRIVERLGFRSLVVSRDAWKNRPFSEIPFLAADAKGEDVYLSAAEDHLRGKVLLTGYCGSVWGGRSNRYYNFLRTDPSGLSLTEYRLWIGFINFPLPVLGVYQADDLRNLMKSDEPAQWANGNSYDKPFCRYVLSSCGVPDNWYGNTKKAASVLIEDRNDFLSPESLADFENYLSTVQSSSVYQLRTSIDLLSRKFAGVGQSLARSVGNASRIKALRRLGNSVRISEFAGGDPRFKYLFPWAVCHAKRRYIGQN